VIILVTGGARSGKSTIAEARCLAFASNAAYIATAQGYGPNGSFDAEMTARIDAHRARRGAEWTTYAAPIDLVATLTQASGQPRLVDCLTLWLTNVMLADHDITAACDALVLAITQSADPTILVTNEVGMGIVPDNALARAFRDAQGILNQKIAAIADEVIFAVSGLPLKVK
jgi:adenosylcobinamide kinase / adenosylcobinamide-phosphate guanylyltransferase